MLPREVPNGPDYEIREDWKSAIMGAKIAGFEPGSTIRLTAGDGAMIYKSKSLSGLTHLYITAYGRDHLDDTAQMLFDAVMNISDGRGAVLQDSVEGRNGQWMTWIFYYPKESNDDSKTDD